MKIDLNSLQDFIGWCNHESSSPNDKFYQAGRLAERFVQQKGMTTEQIFAEEKRCQLPPEGWRCDRGVNHPGPCAAYQINQND